MFLLSEKKKKKNAGLETRAPKKRGSAHAFDTIGPDQALGGQTPAE